MNSLYMLDDFAVSPSGTFREATAAESIAQDLTHLIQEADELGEPTTAELSTLLRGQILDLLTTHPNVTSIDEIDITSGDDNTLDIAVYVNGNPMAITASTGG